MVAKAKKKKKPKPIPTDINLRKLVRGNIRLLPSRPRSHGFHPSQMARLCPVKYWYYEKAREDMGSEDPIKRREGFALLHKLINGETHDVAPGGRFKAELQQEFSVGHAIHEAVQYQLGLVGVLWGKWKCPQCNFTTDEGFMPRAVGRDIEGQPLDVAAPCTSCGGCNLRHQNTWLYVELAVGDNLWEVDGHRDGEIRLNRDDDLARMTLEIKSINDAGYMERTGPLPKPEHVEQASIYAWASGHKYIQFIYVCKNQVHRWKEFIVPINQRAVSVAQSKIQAVLHGRRENKPPLFARVCQDNREKKARGCPLVEECFGSKPPMNIFGV